MLSSCNNYKLLLAVVIIVVVVVVFVVLMFHFNFSLQALVFTNLFHYSVICCSWYCCCCCCLCYCYGFCCCCWWWWWKYWLLTVSHHCPGLNPGQGMWEGYRWLWRTAQVTTVLSSGAIHIERGLRNRLRIPCSQHVMHPINIWYRYSAWRTPWLKSVLWPRYVQRRPWLDYLS